MMLRASWVLVLIGVAGCGPAAEDVVSGTGPGGKADTGWLSDTSFEVGGVLEAVITHRASWAWANLATDRTLQEQLVDLQVKFAKRAAMAYGYEINQLAYRVRFIEAKADAAGDVTLRYRAAIDMVKNEGASISALPTLEELAVRDFDVPLPLDPIDVMSRVSDRCAGDLEGYSLYESNYYYYFDAQKEGCDLKLHTGKLSIETVYPRRRAYPEYDKLLGPIANAPGLIGFRAALLPTRGDDDPASIFSGMKGMLERELGITGVDASDGKYRRYEWTRGGATMVIDLYDPNAGFSIKETFQAALGSYQLVFFAGHSEYGTRDLYDDKTKFSDAYQIVMMWACHSYAYYARQVFRAKATAADPDGFARADFVGTAPTPFFGDETRGIRDLLKGLMQGIAAVSEGKDADAPDWMSIIERMNLTSFDRPYGAAGARDNAWQPAL